MRVRDAAALQRERVCVYVRQQRLYHMNLTDDAFAVAIAKTAS